METRAELLAKGVLQAVEHKTTCDFFSTRNSLCVESGSKSFNEPSYLKVYFNQALITTEDKSSNVLLVKVAGLQCPWTSC